jgi:hypothetical protein
MVLSAPVIDDVGLATTTATTSEAVTDGDPRSP